VAKAIHEGLRVPERECYRPRLRGRRSVRLTFGWRSRVLRSLPSSVRSRRALRAVFLVFGDKARRPCNGVATAFPIFWKGFSPTARPASTRPRIPRVAQSGGVDHDQGAFGQAVGGGCAPWRNEDSARRSLCAAASTRALAGVWQRCRLCSKAYMPNRPATIEVQGGGFWWVDGKTGAKSWETRTCSIQRPHQNTGKSPAPDSRSRSAPATLRQPRVARR